jgi:CzcA family heavy metal efflux pump
VLRAIVRLCLRHPWLTVFATIGIAIAGALALFNANYDVFPNFAPPIVTVYTIVPGLAPRDIESLVTTPIESAVNGTPGLANLRSQSIAGLSVVTATFHGNTGLYRDRELVAQRVAATASLLPANARPVLPAPESAAGNVLDVGLTSDRMSLMQLTELTRAVIRPALLAVPGVANAPIFGAQPHQWQVQVDPQKLLSARIGLNQVTAAAGTASSVRSAGILDTANQRFVVQSHGQAADLAQLAQTVIKSSAQTPLSLGDVANVVAASPPPIGAALIGQKQGLLLVVTSLYGSNTLKVAQGLRQAIARLRPGLAREGVQIDGHALEPTTFIVEALHDLRDSVAIGAGLILVVLIFALRNWRISLISFVAIPLALLFTIFVLNAFGLSLNTFSLGGLAIALGSIADDAIIDIENIRRRLHENQDRRAPLPRLRVILEASVEVRTPIIFATITIALVFLPLFALGGIAGRLFVPLAIAFIVAIFASLLLAMTATPAMAGLLLGAARIAPGDPFFVRATRRLHGRALAGVRRHWRASTAAFVAIVLAAIAALASLVLIPTRFLPQFHENLVIAHFLAPPGTSLPETLGLARRIVARLQKMPQVGHVVVHIGHANLGHGTKDVNAAELDVTLSASGNRHSVASIDAIRDALGKLPGTRFSAGTLLTERIHEVLSATTAPVIIHLFGSHLPAIDADATKVAAAVRKLPGARAVTIAAPSQTPTISVTLRRAALRDYDLQPQTVLDAVQTAFAGREVGRIYRDGTSWPITVVLRASAPRGPPDINMLPVLDGKSHIVPLGTVADVKEYDGRSAILHQNAQRVQNVTVQVRGSASAFVQSAKKALAGISLAPGTYFAFGGTAVAAAGTQLKLLLYGIGVFALITVLLTVALGAVRPAVLLAVNLPFSLLGGIVALWITGMPLSLGAAVGLVTVFGITLRNGLMLLAHYRHLVATEGVQWCGETADRGAVERVVPVLLTAVVTALGLLPLAIGTGLPGQEIEGPMAIVILGGLIIATPLTLLALPSLSSRLLRAEDVSDAAETLDPAT